MKQELRGKVTKLKGRVAEAAGVLTGDRKLERQGAKLRASGTVAEGLGKAKRKAGEFISDVGKAIKR